MLFCVDKQDLSPITTPAETRSTRGDDLPTPLLISSRVELLQGGVIAGGVNVSLADRVFT